MRSTLLIAASALAIIGGASLAHAQTDGGTISVGGRAEGRTDDDGRDYRLSLRRGEGIEVFVGSDDVDTFVHLYKADDTDEALASDDDSGGDLNARLRFVAEEDGEYILRASAFSAGQFEMTVNRWRPIPMRASNISVGRSDNGRLNNRSSQGDDGQIYQAYRLNMRAGQRVEISVRSEGFDPMVFVGHDRPVFSSLAENDDAPGQGLNSRLLFTAPTDGSYLIKVSSPGGQGTGRYTIALREAEPLAAPTPFTVGETVNGEITDETQIGMSSKPSDRYSLSVVAGRAYQIDMESSDMDSYLSLFDAAGKLVQSDDDGGGNLDASLTFVAKEDATYVIEASALSEGRTGPYSLSVEEVAAPPAPTPIAMGATVEGELTDDDARKGGSGRYDAYSFSATEGQRLQITLESSDFDALLELGKAGDDFDAMVTDDDGAGRGTDSRILFDVPETGEYVIRASSYQSDERGGYELRLTDRGPKPERGSVMVGSTVRGSLSDRDNTSEGGIGSGAFYDEYTFHASKDEKLRFILVAPTFDAVVMVRSASAEGSSWGKQDDDGLSDTHSRLIWSAPNDGEYVVRVTSFQANSTGDYSLIVEPQP
ncbi:PPC domain-containing protein [uncultured Brevundimonas sp.]|uniref:PPC domain-containing protein n=1 Tax=uncultured Brevundimonas sp. TaxID=213418 RepID=UPI00260E098D|nr:PPC domain-containing protein [uncultured Brevundimonas sp.]